MRAWVVRGAEEQRRVCVCTVAGAGDRRPGQQSMERHGRTRGWRGQGHCVLGEAALPAGKRGEWEHA